MKKEKSTLDWEEKMVRNELKVTVLHSIMNFKSKEVPGRKLKSNDVINVLSEIITRRTS